MKATSSQQQTKQSTGHPVFETAPAAESLKDVKCCRAAKRALSGQESAEQPCNRHCKEGNKELSDQQDIERPITSEGVPLFGGRGENRRDSTVLTIQELNSPRLLSSTPHVCCVDKFVKLHSRKARSVSTRGLS